MTPEERNELEEKVGNAIADALQTDGELAWDAAMNGRTGTRNMTDANLLSAAKNWLEDDVDEDLDDSQVSW